MVSKYTRQDRVIAELVYLKISSFDAVEFQFPPRIPSDNRKGNWEEKDLPGIEPFAVYKTSGAREFSLTWTYIVDSYQSPGGGLPNFGNGYWTIERIKNQVQKLRGYFAVLRGLDTRENMVVQFAYPHFTGIETWSCRLRSTDVKHGDTLVGIDENIYPLRTDITLDLRLWTTGIPDFEDDFKSIQDIDGLDPEPTLDDGWY